MWKSRKKTKKFCQDGQNAVGDDDDEEEEEKNKYTSVKCGLRKLVRPQYREMIIQNIEAKSIMSTKICALASLLYLYKVQSAYDSGRLYGREFFEQDGQIVIKECFEAVLVQNVNGPKMVRVFRQFVENLDERYPFEWPNNVQFGNGFKDLMKTYVTNTITNLKTHCENRLVNYLKLKIFQSNTATPQIYRFVPNDISNVIDHLIYKKDIECNSNDNEVKRIRRDMLIQMIKNISWFDVVADNLLPCKKSNWFKSMPMWIAMQREIDEYNTSRSQSHQNDQSQPPPKCNQRKKKRGRWHRVKQMLDNAKNPPNISNFAVIPICNFKRTHFTIDNFTLYSLLSQLKIVQRKGNAKIEFKKFMKEKDMQWNEYFYMRKIRWLVRRKKKFDFRILSDGISVSLQFISPKSEPTTLNLEKVKMDYTNGTIRKVLGIDPGLNKWCTVVQRDIETGKEVNFPFILRNHNGSIISFVFPSVSCSFIRTQSFLLFFFVSYNRSILR